MPHWIAQNTSNMTDEAYQNYSLQGVSRTFALTIPRLPENLRLQVGNAYLLCRINDTIEDEESLTIEQKEKFSSEFVSVVKGDYPAKHFSSTLLNELTDNTPEAEQDLIRNTERIIRLNHSFTLPQRRAIERCVEEMAIGMIRYQGQQSLNGLLDCKELDDYCYYVAGVVGIMLTELFCNYSQNIAENREKMLNLAISFGQGLQMTNILKDIWQDQQRGVCWLPQDIFVQCNFDIKDIAAYRNNPCYQAGLESLIAIATTHLRKALQYTLLIPAKEKGIRRFCFWTLGMALLTLRKLNRHINFHSGQEVKISRHSVKAVIAATELVIGGDKRASWLFDFVTKDFPQSPRNTAVNKLNIVSRKVL